MAVIIQDKLDKLRQTTYRFDNNLKAYPTVTPNPSSAMGWKVQIEDVIAGQTFKQKLPYLSFIYKVLDDPAWKRQDLTCDIHWVLDDNLLELKPRTLETEKSYRRLDFLVYHALRGDTLRDDNLSNLKGREVRICVMEGLTQPDGQKGRTSIVKYLPA